MMYIQAINKYISTKLNYPVNPQYNGKLQLHLAGNDELPSFPAKDGEGMEVDDVGWPGKTEVEVLEASCSQPNSCASKIS